MFNFSCFWGRMKADSKCWAPEEWCCLLQECSTKPQSWDALGFGPLILCSVSCALKSDLMHLWAVCEGEAFPFLGEVQRRQSPVFLSLTVFTVWWEGPVFENAPLPPNTSLESWLLLCVGVVQDVACPTPKRFLINCKVSVCESQQIPQYEEDAALKVEICQSESSLLAGCKPFQCRGKERVQG